MTLHPQYLALAITGVGTALVWPRFFVLITLVTMMFLYVLLADWEEGRCLAQFGEDYRRYQSRTGRFLPKKVTVLFPRVLPATGAARLAALAGAYIVTIPASLLVEVRDREVPENRKFHRQQECYAFCAERSDHRRRCAPH